MMLVKILVSAIALINSCCNDSVEFHLLDKEIYLKSGETEISFDLKARSTSCENILMYNFNNDLDLAFDQEAFFCNPEIAAGATIFVYNQEMEPVFARIPPIPDEINYKSITTERVQQVIAEEKVMFRITKQIIKAGESIVFGKKADLKNFRLSPGTYYMKLLYSAGDNTFNMVTKDQVAEDVKKFEARVFKGCVSSNVVKLIVE